MAVSQENTEIVREFMEAFNRKDYAACLEAIDPDVEWHPPPDIPSATVANGRDSLIANFQDWLGAWDDYRSIPEEIIEGTKGAVVVFALESGRGRGSGIEVDSRRITGVYELRNGKIVRFRAYLERTEALEAAGLAE